ncbi:MAG TPA: hypothetical protein VEI28_03545 [Thermodesulfovibrionales bacterium]|nr:hypothetical protein [Thermodesulfovibrionales bacterium]
MGHKLTVFLLTLMFFVGCQGEVVVPPHLIGVWATSAPKYAGRYLRITDHRLIYGLGEGEEVSHEIEKIDSEQGNGGKVYTFHYRDSERKKWTITLTFRSDAGSIQIKNIDGIWERTKTGDSGQ